MQEAKEVAEEKAVLSTPAPAERRTTSITKQSSNVSFLYGPAISAASSNLPLAIHLHADDAFLSCVSFTFTLNMLLHEIKGTKRPQQNGCYSASVYMASSFQNAFYWLHLDKAGMLSASYFLGR